MHQQGQCIGRRALCSSRWHSPHAAAGKICRQAGSSAAHDPSAGRHRTCCQSGTRLASQQSCMWLVSTHAPEDLFRPAPKVGIASLACKRLNHALLHSLTLQHREYPTIQHLTATPDHPPPDSRARPAARPDSWGWHRGAAQLPCPPSASRTPIPPECQGPSLGLARLAGLRPARLPCPLPGSGRAAAVLTMDGGCGDFGAAGLLAQADEKL